jgi:hypothetical protein
MPEIIDSMLGGFNDALDGMSGAVKGMGDAVGTTRGQLAHVTHFSGELVDGVSRLKLQAFRLAETLESPPVRRAVAAGFVLFLAAANILRGSLAASPGKKKGLF